MPATLIHAEFGSEPGAARGRSMSRQRPAAGGGRVVEVEPDRVPGWINRFGVRNDGVASVTGSLSTVTVTGGNGTVATLAVPFPPMRIGDAEPVQAMLDHVGDVGPTAAILVRAGAYSIGVCRDGVVQTSSTDTRYVQSRTAAGGWSQQRYARRRSNQRRDANRAAADTAHRVLAPVAGSIRALVVGGEPGAIREVLADPRLAFLAELPRRTFTDIAEPRRAVLDQVAARCLAIEITVRPVPPG
jgi:hypothetical protein